MSAWDPSATRYGQMCQIFRMKTIETPIKLVAIFRTGARDQILNAEICP